MSESSSPSDPSPSHTFRLILMRHAKSDWSGEQVSDHERPLNRRGLRDAPTMARWIAEAGFLPDLILCSSATRTQQTAALMQSYWKNTNRDPAALLIREDLYLATSRTLFHVVAGLDIVAGIQQSVARPQVKTVLVLAHNPGISDAAAELLGYPLELSTAAVVIVRCDLQNGSMPLNASTTELIAEMKPKLLDGPQ